MIASKTLTAIAAAVAVAGSIGIAYAQATAPAPYTAPSTDKPMPMDAARANMPTTPVPSGMADDGRPVAAERSARADRN